MLPKYVICDVETTGVEDDDWPIEVGCLFLDENFVILKTYESLIYHSSKGFQDMLSKVEKDKTSYWKRFEATTIHRIDPDSYEKGAVNALAVAQKLTDLCMEQHPIMISDCANFEYRMLKKLFVETGHVWPFHYCVWDTSLMFKVEGIKHPVNEHRAFRDVTLLYRKILEALDKKGYV